jgi:hypothetical protein
MPSLFLFSFRYVLGPIAACTVRNICCSARRSIRICRARYARSGITHTAIRSLWTNNHAQLRTPIFLIRDEPKFGGRFKGRTANIVNKENNRIVKMNITFGKAYPRLQVQLETLTEPTSEVFEFAGHSRQESVTLGSR